MNAQEPLSPGTRGEVRSRRSDMPACYARIVFGWGSSDREELRSGGPGAQGFDVSNAAVFRGKSGIHLPSVAIRESSWGDCLIIGR